MVGNTGRNPFKTPPSNQPSQCKPGQLTADQLDGFFAKGWLMIPDFFDKNVLENVKIGIMKQVDELAEKLHRAGKITDKHEDKDFFSRMTYIEKQFPGAAVLLHKSGVLPEGGKEVWCYEKLLNVGEQIIGPEIAGHPVWNLRVKLPMNEASVVPWHQDNGYFDDSSLDTMILTAWVPLLDTNEDNGGMQMISNTHNGTLATHFCCAGGTWYVEVEEDVIEKTFGCRVESKNSCDVPYGGVLLFSNVIIHRSTHNRTNNIRWSMDLRWQDPRLPNGRDELNEKMPLMRSEENRVENIDWSLLSNRQHNDRAAFLQTEEESNCPEDEFDTRIGGPWMKKWPIKNHNVHTDFELNKTQT